jgi:epoxide hydrolase-like predicted phosphatase
MPIKAVVFDIGGVLEINPRTGWPALWATRLKLEPREFEQRLESIWGPGSIGALSLEEIERRTADALGLDHATLAALMSDWWAEYIGTLNRELADYFGGLRPWYRTGILSNSFVGAREREQAAYGFEDMCDVIVYSHEVGWRKPDPRIYHVVCERLGVPPEDAVLLDDVQENVDGARAVGMRAIAFANTRQAIADLRAQMTT